MNPYLKELKKAEQERDETNTLYAHAMYKHLMEAINTGTIPKDKVNHYRQTAELWLSTVTPEEKVFIFDSTH